MSGKAAMVSAASSWSKKSSGSVAYAVQARKKANPRSTFMLLPRRDVTTDEPLESAPQIRSNHYPIEAVLNRRRAVARVPAPDSNRAHDRKYLKPGRRDGAARKCVVVQSAQLVVQCYRPSAPLRRYLSVPQLGCSRPVDCTCARSPKDFAQ